MTYITRIANKRILAKYFLYSLQINYLHWKLSASRSIFSCYATIIGIKDYVTGGLMARPASIKVFLQNDDDVTAHTCDNRCTYQKTSKLMNYLKT